MIIINSILYLIVFFVTTVGIFIALFISLYAVLGNLGFGKNIDDDEDELSNNDDPNYDPKYDYLYQPYGVNFKISFPSFTAPLLLVCAIISLPLSYYVISAFKYYPPFLESRPSVEEQGLNAKQNVDDLSDEAERIHNALSNIHNLTLDDLEKVLSNTLVYLEKLKEEAIKKEQALSKLKEEIAKTQNQRQAEENLLKKFNDLSRPQLNEIADILYEPVARDSNKTFWLGAFISFPIGVFAELFASWILSVRSKRRAEQK